MGRTLWGITERGEHNGENTLGKNGTGRTQWPEVPGLAVLRRPAAFGRGGLELERGDLQWQGGNRENGIGAWRRTAATAATTRSNGDGSSDDSGSSGGGSDDS